MVGGITVRVCWRSALQPGSSGRTIYVIFEGNWDVRSAGALLGSWMSKLPSITSEAVAVSGTLVIGYS